MNIYNKQIPLNRYMFYYRFKLYKRADFVLKIVIRRKDKESTALGFTKNQFRKMLRKTAAQPHRCSVVITRPMF